MNSRPATRKNSYLRVFVIAILLTIATGGLLTGFLGRVAEKEFTEGINRETNLITSLLNDNLHDVEHAAMALGSSDAIVAALDSGSPADLVRANKLLDRINSNFKMSVSYLLDRNGLTVASTNRYEKNSFVDQTFAFRPYFTDAMAGRLPRYFAFGSSSHIRGYYAAAPVISSGTITGVVVIKRNIASFVEEEFRKYPHAFLVSPEGIIFITSKDDFLFKALWPVDERQRSELLAAKRFGKITFEPLLAAEPRTGTYVKFENEEHYLQRLPIGNDGWSVVMIEHPHIVASYRLFGVLLTAVITLLLLLFFFVLQYKNKSLEMAKDLLKSKDDWKRTFDTVPDLIATIDTNHRIISMNRAMAERLGISPNDAAGRRCCELVHGSTEPPPSCPHQRALDSRTNESESLSEMNLNGDFTVTVTPLLAEDGTIESTIHVMHDITELKQLERSLKEYAQRLEYVLEGSNDATWEWDMIADQATLNMRYYELLGYTPGETDLNFATFLTTIHPDDAPEVQRLMQEHLDRKTSGYEAHYRTITKSGIPKDVMMRGKIISFDAAGRPLKMAGVTTDVTEQKRLSEEVNRTNNLASIGLLAGGLAHDFNNVLNVIYGNISFAKMLVGGTADIIEPLTDAEEACERARELGLRLQVFAQENTPVKEAITLPALIEQVAGVLFKGSNILSTISVADDIHPIEADPRQIRQVFENLLTNAKEAMAAGGTVTVKIENYLVNSIKILPIDSGNYVRIAIMDNGKGIQEENLPKIFDPYFSTKDTYSQKGLGLGLSICHAIMKRHSGHISVESTVGISTRVIIYLPALCGRDKTTLVG